MAETPEESVVYERQQLHAFHNWYAAYLQQRKPEEIDQIVSNAFIEAFLVHYRNLIDFLSPRKTKHPDDITAADFVPGFVSTKAPRQYRDRIDKSLSHLSQARASVEDKGWDLTQMLVEMEQAWSELVEQARSLAEEE
jgi:hypothetical protein